MITQRKRFTQASTKYGIPKGTLYDNILGKANRLKALEDMELKSVEEDAVLEYCCETSVMPYNRRTNKSLKEILTFIENLKDLQKPISLRRGYRWWWAFCKKHSIISLHYDSTPLTQEEIQSVGITKTEETPAESADSPSPPALMSPFAAAAAASMPYAFFPAVFASSPGAFPQLPQNLSLRNPPAAHSSTTAIR